MGDVFFKTYYHIVWETKNRAADISKDIEKVLYPYLVNTAKKLKCKIIACGGYLDHIHLLIEIPPSLSISHIVGQLKGSSSHYLNNGFPIPKSLFWQTGYGVLTVSERNIPAIIQYINSQEIHHEQNRLSEEFEISSDNATN